MWSLVATRQDDARQSVHLRVVDTYAAFTRLRVSIRNARTMRSEANLANSLFTWGWEVLSFTRVKLHLVSSLKAPKMGTSTCCLFGS